MILATLFAALASFAVLVVVFVPLERAFPARPGQKILRAELAIDAAFFFGQYLAWSAIAVATIERVGPLVASNVGRGLPLWIQIIVAVMAGDFLVYWFHRACHAFEPLWRFHAVHHTATELDWLAAHREHPIDGILTQICMNVPAYVLGVPAGALAGIVMFRGLWAVFIHSNVRLPLGPLKWLVGSPELHHWHHANVGGPTHNFANLGPWLDLVFGTHHAPGPEHLGPNGEETYPLGIDAPEGESPWPRGYVAQLVHPFALFLERSRPARRATTPFKPVASEGGTFGAD